MLSGALTPPAAAQAKEVVALERSEALAEGGDVDGSQLFATQAEAFAAQHAEALRALTAPERLMAVCETCGVFMQQLDNSDPKRKARAEEARAAARVGVARLTGRCAGRPEAAPGRFGVAALFCAVGIEVTDSAS